MRKYRNQILAGLAIALAIYIIMLIFMDSSGYFDEDVLTALNRFPLWLIPILVLTQISAGFFRFWEWHYYLEVIEARDKLSVKDSLIIFIAAFTMVVSPGKVAEVLKSVLLKMRTGVTVAKSAPIVLAERIVDGLAVIITLLLTLLFASEQLHLGDYKGMAQAIIFTSAGLLGFGLIAVQIAPLAYFCLNIVAKLPVVFRLYEPLKEFYESSREIFKLKHVIPTTLMGMGVYISSTVGYVLILWGFGLEITSTLILQATFMVGVASAIGALSFVPNGAGVTEISNVAMLTAIVAPQNPLMTPAVAAASSLLQGFFHKWFRVLVGAGVAYWYRDRLFTSDLEQELAIVEREKAAHKPALTVEKVL